jgi:hypothetical protein
MPSPSRDRGAAILLERRAPPLGARRSFGLAVVVPHAFSWLLVVFGQGV